MYLELDPLDLAPQWQVNHGTAEEPNLDQKCSTSEVTFEKLNRRAQKAVVVVGSAHFRSWDNRTYNRITVDCQRKKEGVDDGKSD